MRTKLIALDVYGTFLSTEDHDNELQPRTGFEEFVERTKQQGIKLVTASDASIDIQKIDIEETFNNSRYNPRPTLEIFDNFYQLKTIPKDVSQILQDYNLTPEQLFIIGDTYEKDIEGAKELGCNVFEIPEFKGFVNSYDFNQILIN